MVQGCLQGRCNATLVSGCCASRGFPTPWEVMVLSENERTESEHWNSARRGHRYCEARVHSVAKWGKVPSSLWGLLQVESTKRQNIQAYTSVWGILGIWRIHEDPKCQNAIASTRPIVVRSKCTSWDLTAVHDSPQCFGLQSWKLASAVMKKIQTIANNGMHD